MATKKGSELKGKPVAVLMRDGVEPVDYTKSQPL